MRQVRFEQAQAGAPKGGPVLLKLSTGSAIIGLSTFLRYSGEITARIRSPLGGYVIDRRKRLCEPEMAGYYGSARPPSTGNNWTPDTSSQTEAEMQKITPLKTTEGIAA